MDKYPERIWAVTDAGMVGTGRWVTQGTENPFGNVEYVHADLYEQVKAQSDRFCEKYLAALSRAEAAERLAGARVVTDAMVEEAIEAGGFSNSPYTVQHMRYALEAIIPALAEPAGEVEPLSAQIERLASFIMEHVPGEPSQSEGAVDCAIRVIRNSLSTPPGASAIREAAIQLLSAIDTGCGREEIISQTGPLRAALIRSLKGGRDAQ